VHGTNAIIKSCPCKYHIKKTYKEAEVKMCYDCYILIELLPQIPASLTSVSSTRRWVISFMHYPWV